MAICLPGMASRVNRAATSETRSAPLVTTIICTSTIIRKMMKPRTIFPWVIMLPKDWMTAPALPLLPRICRVVEIFSPNRNRVVISSRDGKMEKSSASATVMVMTRMSMDREMLTTSRMSSSWVGRGTTIKRTIMTTASAMAFWRIRFMHSVLSCQRFRNL